MKRFFLILFAALLTGGMAMQAEPVSESRAREVAMKVLAAQPATKASSGDVKLIWDGENAATKAAGNPAFYVFGSDRGGFVIIAGDDNVQPVLAISETSQFKVEGMPENMKWWMETMKTYVRSASTPAPEVRKQWAKFADTKADPIEENDARLTGKVGHKTPEWNQGNSDNFYFGRQVFNTKCPLDDSNNRTITGCVATALGELLTTMSGLYADKIAPYPLEPNAPGYAVSEGKKAAAEEGSYYSFTSEPYLWAQLRTLTGTAAINAAIAAENTALLDDLARLLADLGAMTQAQYGTTSTGAVSEYATTMMARYMGLHKGARFEYAEDYSIRQWKEMLKAELSRHPVFFSGRKESSGHAFLLDGYAWFNDTEEMFYVNFGWSGQGNGYYLVNQFGDYTQLCAAAFNFYPDPSSTYPTIIKMVCADLADPRDGFSYTSGAPSANGDAVIINHVYIENKGQETYIGPVRLVAVDKNGVVKQEFQQFYITGGLPSGYYVGLYFPSSDNLHIEYDFAFGDKIILQYSPDGTSWEKISSYWPSCNLIDELPLMPAAFIETESAYHVGDYFQFKLINNDIKYRAAQWYFTGPDGVRSSPQPQSQYEYQLTSPGRYKVEVAVIPILPSDGGTVVETITTYITVE